MEKFDVVEAALVHYRDKLQALTNNNIKMDMFNIMDDIRLEQIEELNQAINQRKASKNGND